jgi:hypothetical protein
MMNVDLVGKTSLLFNYAMYVSRQCYIIGVMFGGEYYDNNVLNNFPVLWESVTPIHLGCGIRSCVNEGSSARITELYKPTHRL